MSVQVANPVTEYAERVVSGEIETGHLVRLAVERHLRDIVTGHERGLRFDDRAAERAITFFPLLRHSKGEWAGHSFELEPWQQFIVGSLFGWKRVDGYRRFRTAYLSVARKNGKSTLVAGLGLLLAFFDDEPGAEVYAAATNEKQASITWNEAAQMVRQSPGLSGKIKAFKKNLHDPETASKYEPVSKEYKRLDGLNIHAAIVDEYHAHPTGEVADVLESATGSRRQPLIIYTTTAGHDNESACHTFDVYVQQILEGVVEDDTTFGFIARMDDDDAWDEPDNWIKANPNLGVSVKLDDLERQCERAKAIPREQNEFRRKRCNQWTEQAERWLDLRLWDACDARPRVQSGARGFAGLDLSSTTDLSAWVMLFPDGDAYDVVCRFWLPEDTLLERSRRDGVPYDVWERQGWIETTPGDVVDYEFIRAAVNEDSEQYQVHEIGFDAWNASQLATQLMGDGANMVRIPQNFSSLNEACKELERLLRAGRIRHGGNPVLRWMAANVAVDEGPNESIRPSKKKSHERIDGIVALVMALARSMVHQQADKHEPRTWSWAELPA